ncbi:hypothetical protein ACFYNY_16610 [Streptomyces sp. NPDC006530]|uniref:hypothetical protein n=1 Tax=Streptomyces sp. NPDC006530 TaxID=3364750 RepID=UPI0036CA7F48
MSDPPAWHENGAWSRAPYPEGLDDDGLDCGMSRFVDRGDVLGSIDLGQAAARRTFWAGPNGMN